MPWDFPVHTVILSLSFFFSLITKNNKKTKTEINFKILLKNIIKTIYYILPIIFLAIMLWLPSYFDFSQYKPLRISVLRTSITEFLIVYLLFVFIILIFLVSELKNKKRIYFIITMIALLILIKISNARAPLFIFILLISSIFIFFKNLNKNLKLEKEKIFSILLLVCALGLLFIIEYIYVYDVLAISWSRMNTVFKIGISVWLLFGISCSYFLYCLRKKISWIIFSILVACLIIIASGYPILATISKRTIATGTLDGLSYLQQQHPYDYGVISWLNKNVKGRATILESIEPDYYYTSPVTSFTGLNGVIAWPGHEIQWNIKIYPELQQRINDVNETYTTLNQEKAKELLKKYDVDYVVVGENEIRKYSPESLEKFSSFLEIAYENEGAKLYKVE